MMPIVVGDPIAFSDVLSDVTSLTTAITTMFTALSSYWFVFIPIVLTIFGFVWSKVMSLTMHRRKSGRRGG